MRRKPGTLLPIEADILDAGLALRRAGGPRFHGFQLAKQIADHAGPRPLTAHGTLYKALQRLEEAGLLTSQWEDPNIAATEGRPRRRLYEVTGAGGRAGAGTTAAGADMSTADRTAGLVLWWVATYTRHLPAEVAERRRAELASDLWEQRAYGRALRAPAPAVALSILRCMTAGMPADLRWRQRQLAATRGRPLIPGGRPVLRTLARNWWLVLAALVGIFEVAFGVAMPFEEGGNPGSIAGGALIATAGLLTLGGIATRRRARVAGDVMIAVGAMPMMPWIWIIPLPLAGLTVIVAAVVDAAEARSLGQRGAPAESGQRVVLGVAAVLVAVLVALLVIGAPQWSALAAAPVLLGLVVYLGLWQRRRAA